MKVSKTLRWALAGICMWAIPAAGENPCEQRGHTSPAIHRVHKPCLAALEDCLAYALDIPLAMLSPITCPIVNSIRDALDPVEEPSRTRSSRNR